MEKYDSRTMSGIVSILGPSGRIELPFPMSSIMRAGITSLRPGHELECTMKKRADGPMLVEEIKLSVGKRAAALAELKRQAEAAEENYRIDLMRRRLDSYCPMQNLRTEHEVEFISPAEFPFCDHECREIFVEAVQGLINGSSVEELGIDSDSRPARKLGYITGAK
jgi:hypothetical protein